MIGKGQLSNQTRSSAKSAAKVTPELNVQSQKSVQNPNVNKTRGTDLRKGGEPAYKRSLTNNNESSAQQNPQYDPAISQKKESSQGNTTSGGLAQSAIDSGQRPLEKLRPKGVGGHSRTKVTPQDQFNSNDDDDKAVIGLPGDSVDVSSEQNYANATFPPEPFSSTPHSVSNINSGPEPRPASANDAQSKPQSSHRVKEEEPLNQGKPESESESYESLDSVDRKKLAKICRAITGGRGFFDDESEENIEDLVDQAPEKDPYEDLDEGIFIFQAHKGTCQIPVDESKYLSGYPGDDIIETLALQNQVSSATKAGQSMEPDSAVPKSATLRPSATMSQKPREKWEYAKKIVVYDGRSLYIFHHSTTLRRLIVMIVEHKIFDNLILFLILLNTIQLAIYDYNDRDNCFPYNQTLESGSFIFSVCFMVECAFRVSAYGFVKHYNSYLRDVWNWIDFAVVLISIIELSPIEGANLKGLRTLRVLRPLRSIKGFPAMKRQISALQNSMVPLGHATAFISMLFVLFGILGVSQFAGAFYQRCRFMEPSDDCQYSVEEQEWPAGLCPAVYDGVWLHDEDQQNLCSLDGTGTYACLYDTVCGTPLQIGLEAYSDNLVEWSIINYGITTFDNLALSTVTIIQMITLEGWVDIMYNLMDAGNPIVSVVFCVLVVAICSWFLLNIILAVLSEGIAQVEDEDKAENLLKTSHTQSIKRARLQKQKKYDLACEGNEDGMQPKLSSRKSPRKKSNENSFNEDVNKEGNIDTESKTLPRSRSLRNELATSDGLATPGGFHLDANEVDRQLQQINNRQGAMSDSPEPSPHAKQGDLPVYRVDPNELSQKIQEAVPRKREPSHNRSYLEEVPEEQSDAVLSHSHMEFRSKGSSSHNQQFKSNSLRSRPAYIQVPMESSNETSLNEMRNVTAPFHPDGESREQELKAMQAGQKKAPQAVQIYVESPPTELMKGSLPMSPTSRSPGATPGITPKSKANDIYTPEHAYRNKFFMFCFKVCSHCVFTNFVTFLIVANTIVLALDRYGMPQHEKDTLDYFNQFFTWAFVAEMVIKLLGLGFKEYAKDSFNLFDAVIVTLSMVEFAVETAGLESIGGGAFQVLRAIRILRIFKLARRWKKLADILQKMYVTVIDIRTFAVLLLIFMVILMLLGLELFAYKIRYEDDDEPVPPYYAVDTCPLDPATGYPVPMAPAGASPRESFDNPLFGLITVFIVFVGDDWNTIMYSHYRVLKPGSTTEAWIGVVFFIMLFIIGNLVLMNLFLAILLKNFDDSGAEAEEAEKGDDSDSDDDEDDTPFQRFKMWCKLKFCPCCLKVEDEADEASKLGVELDADGKPLSKFALAFRRMLMEGVPASMRSQPAAEDEDDQAFNSGQSCDNDKGDETQPGNQQDGQNRDPSKSAILPANESKSADLPRRSNTGTTPGRAPAKSAAAASPGPSPKENLFASLRNLKNKLKNARLKDAKSKLDALKSAPYVSMAMIKKSELIEDTAKVVTTEIKLEGYSLFCLGPTNPLRLFTKGIVGHSSFDTLILLLIGISTVLLCMEMPLEDPERDFANALGYLDRVMTVLFIIEMVLKIVTLGFAFGENAYLKSGWNDMDFVIVMVSIFDLLPIDADIGFIKVIRLLRVLRPLRMIAKNPGMKIAVESIIKSIPHIFHLLLISFMFLGLFSIIGVTFYKGLFFYCDMTNVPAEQQHKVHTMWECMDYGGEWLNTQANFDNFINGLTTFFTVMTSEGWVSVMWQAVDCSVAFHTPLKNNSLFSTLFFMLFITIGALFILNLFVGVVIGNFGTEKEKLVRNNLLTELQMEYCDSMAKCYQAKPVPVYQPTGNIVKDKLHYFATSRGFENTVFVCIVINTVCMAATWYAENASYTTKMEWVNLAFTIIYTVEAGIKLFVFGKLYFADGWNNFDFMIVVVAWLGFFLEAVFELNVGSAATLIRSFRIARVFKMIRRFKSMRKIFNTFVVALPSLGNVGSLLLLLLLLYSILGVFFFAKVQLQEFLNEHANFQNFGRAMLTLLRCTTGEAFNDIMWDITRPRDINYQCVAHDQSYEELAEFGPRGCGQSQMGTAYFVSFIMAGFVILLNLFIAIILENYDNSQKEENMRISEYTLERFTQEWKKYDPEATGFIKVDDLDLLIADLVVAELDLMGDSTEDKLFTLTKNKLLLFHVKQVRGMELDERMAKRLKGFPQLQKQVDRTMNRFTGTLQVPTFCSLTYYNFHDTLAALSKYVFEQQCGLDYKERKDRIANNLKYGVELTKLDKMKEGSNAFWRLTLTEQEEFLETDHPSFDKVINRLESKGQNKLEPIDKLQRMKLLRIERGKQATTKSKGGEERRLDESAGGRILDSSQLFGARVILRAVRAWKANKARALAEAEGIERQGTRLSWSQSRLLAKSRGSLRSKPEAGEEGLDDKIGDADKQDLYQSSDIQSDHSDDGPARGGEAIRIGEAVKIRETEGTVDDAEIFMTQPDEVLYKENAAGQAAEKTKFFEQGKTHQSADLKRQQAAQAAEPPTIPAATTVTRAEPERDMSPVMKRALTNQNIVTEASPMKGQNDKVIRNSQIAPPVAQSVPASDRHSEFENTINQINQASAESSLMLPNEQDIDRDFKKIVAEAEQRPDMLVMEGTSFQNNNSFPKARHVDLSPAVVFQPDKADKAAKGNNISRKRVPKKNKDDFGIFSLQSSEQEYMPNEAGGGMRADDSPLHFSNPSDYGTLKSQKSTAARKAAVRQQRRVDSDSDQYDGEGGRNFRGEIQAQVIKRNSDMNFEQSQQQIYKSKATQRTNNQQTIFVPRGYVPESERNIEEWAKNSPYQKRSKHAKTTSPKSGSFAVRPEGNPRINNYDYAPEGQQYLRKPTYDNSALLSSNMTNNEKILQLQKQEKYELMTVPRKPSVQPRPPSKSKQRMSMVSHYEDKTTSRKLVQQEYQTHTASAFGSTGVLGSSYMQKPAPTFIPSVMKTNPEQNPIHSSPPSQRPRFAQKKLKTQIERHSSMAADRNVYDLANIKNNPNELFASTTYGGLGIGAGLTASIGMGLAKTSIPSNNQSNLSMGDWKNKRTSFDPSVTSKSLMWRNRQQ